MRSWIHHARGRHVRQARVGLGDLREEHISRQGFFGPVAMIYREWGPNEIQEVFRTGDCKAPAQLNQAIWDAHRLAREFDSPHPAYPLPWIRERQLWGGETIPKLGDPRSHVEAAK